MTPPPPRSEGTEILYKKFKEEKQLAGADLHSFNLNDEIVIREFDHWLIIENRFPYDNMTSVNHMLVPKRVVANLSETSDQEQAEHLVIKKILTDEGYYDAVVENFPRSKSVTKHLHLHLIRWKYTS